MASYVLEGPRWGTGTAGTGGGTVTWAVDASVPASFLSDISSAFSHWSAQADITFTRTATTTGADIVFTQSAIDGLNGTLGQANYRYSGDRFVSATVTFDTGEGWHASGSGIVSNSGVDLFLLALHEIGHAIGLGHYDAEPAVMNTFLDTSLTDLTASEVAAIQALYGARPAATVSAASSGLFDGSYYLAAYADVKAAGVDAHGHYDTYGWKEGRDPDAYFDTQGYLAANSDVRAAGINPLTHFDNSGWKEGRDPSATFDVELYLMHNPDVKAAGIDPLQHYLEYGRTEARATYDAIGKVIGNGAGQGSFDAEYYLLSNPDVAKAAIASGGDTFAFAYNHFHTFGWKEGRDPNAYFDTKGYLSAYADVKAAGIDPLAHYDNGGWKEGRDPSASFDTKAYEAHYADVAAAGVDPLRHFIAGGIYEGRLDFADGKFG